MSHEYDTIEVSFEADTGIGHITLDRPDSLNALNAKIREEIVEGLQELESKNPDGDGVALRVVIMEGADGNFSAGADINEFNEATYRRSSARHYRTFIAEFPVPVIAKIRGYCLGGGLETALACDFRIAHEDSQLGLPEVDLGIKPGDGVQFITRLANASVAKELAMLGNHISADEALDANIVNRVHGDKFDDATREFAETIAEKPPLAIQAIKESANMAVETGLSEGRKFDHELGGYLRQTDDYDKATRAFAEDDYEPVFEGK